MHEDVWNDYESLPPEGRRQVADFIAFLRQRYHAAASGTRPLPAWEDEPFVGMWRDRDEMQDSRAWLRRVREQEWAEPRG